MSMLAGIRVLEICDGLTDFGGRMLAELGADVVAMGDDVERAGAKTLAWHHGKTRLSADDPAAVRQLAGAADIVLDGQRLGDRFNLADAVGDQTVLVRVVKFDRQDDGAPMSDLTLMALSGLMTVTGEPDRPPLRFPGEQAYVLTGIQAATAALLGLFARRRIGGGQDITVSAAQSAALANYREAVMYEWTGRVGRRRGNLLVRGKSGVRQVWKCRDGHVTWSMIDNPGMMRALVGVMREQGAAGELEAVDWDNTLVADTAQETIERWQGVVEAFFARHSRAELGAWSLSKGWGLSVIDTPADVLASEHLAARGLFVDVTDAASGVSTRLPGPLFSSSLPHQAPRRTLAAPIPASSFTGWRQT